MIASEAQEGSGALHGEHVLQPCSFRGHHVRRTCCCAFEVQTRNAARVATSCTARKLLACALPAHRAIAAWDEGQSKKFALHAWARCHSATAIASVCSAAERHGDSWNPSGSSSSGSARAASSSCPSMLGRSAAAGSRRQGAGTSEMFTPSRCEHICVAPDVQRPQVV